MAAGDTLVVLRGYVRVQRTEYSVEEMKMKMELELKMEMKMEMRMERTMERKG